MKAKLEEKEREKEHLSRVEKSLKSRLGKMNVANEAAKLYNELAGPYTQESIGDVVLDALRRYKRGESLHEGESLRDGEYSLLTGKSAGF